ncbi:hypothetical protein DRO54_06645 [Candidatus Bathyarchaeota archaeon]|nr:MAG: hypothetical protein DRO54_06645 [Candidatus Bathyarchaeota archaeon]
MKEVRREKSSLFVSTVSIFAALTTISDVIWESPFPYSGVWLSWIFIMEPITGILLTPYASFLSTLLGVMVGHSLRYIDIYEFAFTLGAPLGAMISSLLFRGKWKPALAYYLLLLGVYSLTPISWSLPIYGMWDVYLAFACLLMAILIIVRKAEAWKLGSYRSFYVSALCAFIGLEADVLFRIFLLVPCQTYRIFYGWKITDLQVIWATGAVETPIKAGLAALVSAIIIPSIMKSLKNSSFIQIGY